MIVSTKVECPKWYPKTLLKKVDGAYIFDEGIVNKYDKGFGYTYNIKSSKLYSVYRYNLE